MRLRYLLIAAIAGVIAAVTSTAFAGSPHFITSAFTVTKSGNTVTVSGKEAGLGDESQVNIRLTVEAQCINPGSNHPKAANKASSTANGTFPVQNGKADFTLSTTVTFQPDCTPPMTVQFTNITVTDLTNNLSATFNDP
jgi:hypothetical protein